MLSSFPALTENEFRAGCQALQQRCQGRLDGTDWLSIRWQQDALIIRKAYPVTSPERRDVVTELRDLEEDSAVSLRGAEEDGQALLRHPESVIQSILVDFFILQSPTYQVPVLWFTIHQLPQPGPSGLDAVYHYLVPHLREAGVRQVGVLGGISMAHHPISDLPAFFIHPCNTVEALQESAVHKDIGPAEYLLLWLGLTGSAVNLHVPSKLLLETEWN